MAMQNFRFSYQNMEVERLELETKGHSVTRGGKRSKKDQCYRRLPVSSFSETL